LLKYFAANHTFDKATLAVYNEQLHMYGSEIFAKRTEFLEKFIPIFKTQYKAITGNTEEVHLSYDSKLHLSDMASLLEKTIDRDRALQYTSVGIHKDDLSFAITEYPIKKFGSQGQQKSFLIALKFAQFQFMQEVSQTTPILLLDDIFDKLDEHRVAHIITLVNDEIFGQIFISDTHADRTETVVKKIHQSYKIFKL
jgi:DNA replication and repair protein RecF